MTLLDALKYARANMQGNRGLCDAIRQAYNGSYMDEFRTLCTKWPKYSGTICYPVPSVSSTTPTRAYHDARNSQSLYKGEYGKLRLELLDWCIKELSK